MTDRQFTDDELAIVRRAYARQMLAVAHVADDAIAHAFSTVRREAFLGAPPWHLVSRGGALHRLPASDPVVVYQDAVIALAPERGVNNGSPSLHAAMLHDLAIRGGDRIVHIGCGAGYYTAIIAEIAGTASQVTAVEFDPRLATLARANLAPWRNVTVVEADGGAWPTEPADRIYVSFAAAAPAAAWIEQLAPNGSLLFPLGAPHPSALSKFPRHAAHGAALLVTRRPHGLAARWTGGAYFVCAEGTLAADDDTLRALYQAFERGGIEFVKSLRWREASDPARCWYWTPHWSLSYDEGDAD